MFMVYVISTGKITHNSGDPAEVEHSQQKLLDVFDNIKTTLKKDAKRGDLSLEVNGRTLELYDYSLDDEPLFKCEEGSVRKERSCGEFKTFSDVPTTSILFFYLYQPPLTCFCTFLYHYDMNQCLNTHAHTRMRARTHITYCLNE